MAIYKHQVSVPADNRISVIIEQHRLSHLLDGKGLEFNCPTNIQRRIFKVYKIRMCETQKFCHLRTAKKYKQMTQDT